MVQAHVQWYQYSVNAWHVCSWADQSPDFPDSLPDQKPIFKGTYIEILPIFSLDWQIRGESYSLLWLLSMAISCMIKAVEQLEHSTNGSGFKGHSGCVCIEWTGTIRRCYIKAELINQKQIYYPLPGWQNMLLRMWHLFIPFNLIYGTHWDESYV